MDDLNFRKWTGSLTPEEFESLKGDLSQVLGWIVNHFDLNPSATYLQYVEVCSIIADHSCDLAEIECDKQLPIAEMSRRRRKLIKNQQKQERNAISATMGGQS